MKNGTGLWWAVCSLENHEFYGAAGINNMEKTQKKAEVGCWFLPEHQGNGYMAEVISKICEYGFSQLGLHRMEGFVEAGNSRCKKALDKLDFQYEGTMNDCEIKDGKFISLDIYATFGKRI